MDDVRDFYRRFYTPQNAIVSIVGNVTLEECKSLCEKWFGGIEKPGKPNENVYMHEVFPEEIRRKIEDDLSPNPAVFLLWRGPSAKEKGGQIPCDLDPHHEHPRYTTYLIRQSILLNQIDEQLLSH